MQADECDRLWQAYTFLRNTEHALQGIADKQTQQLPTDQLGKQRVATLLGCDSWVEFEQQLQNQRNYVASAFSDMFAERDAGKTDPGPKQEGEMAWHGSMDLTELLDYLQTAGYQNPQTIAEQLHSLTCAYSSEATTSIVATAALALSFASRERATR